MPNLLAGSLFSRVIGNTLPESVYLSQSYSFKGKLRKDEKVLVEIVVAEVDYKKKRLTLRTRVKRGEEGEVVVDGRAVVLY